MKRIAILPAALVVVAAWAGVRADDYQENGIRHDLGVEEKGKPSKVGFDLTFLDDEYQAYVKQEGTNEGSDPAIP